MYSAITDNIRVVSENTKNIKPTIVPNPAKGTPLDSHKMLSVTSITTEIQEQINANLVIAFIGFLENDSIP